MGVCGLTQFIGTPPPLQGGPLPSCHRVYLPILATFNKFCQHLPIFTNIRQLLPTNLHTKFFREPKVQLFRLVFPRVATQLPGPISVDSALAITRAFESRSFPLKVKYPTNVPPTIIPEVQSIEAPRTWARLIFDKPLGEQISFMINL